MVGLADCKGRNGCIDQAGSAGMVRKRPMWDVREGSLLAAAFVLAFGVWIDENALLPINLDLVDLVGPRLVRGCDAHFSGASARPTVRCHRQLW